MALPSGRPKGGSDARSRLIVAALALFTRRSFPTVSTRELARAAAVDPALIRYYFGSKSGLYEQMVRETLAPMFERIRHRATAAVPDDLCELMQVYYRAMAPHPDLPRLVVRVLQDGEGTEPYRILLSIFSEMIGGASRWFEQAVQAPSQLQSELDPGLARLSLVSLMVFPLIAPPVLMRQFGFTTEPGDLERLARHNLQVLQRGLLGRPAARP